VKLEQHTGKDGAALIGGGRKGHLVDHPAEAVGLQQEAVPPPNRVSGGHSRELGSFDALDIGFKSSALEI